MDLVHLYDQSGTLLNASAETGEVKKAVDLTDFYPSAEWDLLGVPARKNYRYYPCCSEPYPDITFTVCLPLFTFIIRDWFLRINQSINSFSFQTINKLGCDRMIPYLLCNIPFPSQAAF